MKTFINSVLSLVIVSTFLLVATEISSAQNQWELLGPIDFNGIQQLSDGKILVCTNSGSIYSSTNNGDSWSRRLINPQRGYFCMKFFDDMHGMLGAAGQPDLGYINITSDGGKTWIEKIAGSTYIKSLAFPSLDTAFVLADHACFRTIDRGKTWDSLRISTTVMFNKIIFTDARNGFLAGGSGIFYRTTNAGMSWEQVALPSSITYISSFDANAQGRVVVAVAPLIAMSTDNGSHWKVTDFTGRDTFTLPMQLVKIVGNDKIEAFQSGSFRLFSEDFGDTWQAFRLIPTDREINPVISLSASTLYKGIYIDKVGNGFVTGNWGTLYKVRNFGKNISGVVSEVQHHCGVGIGTFPFARGLPFLEVLQHNTNFIRGFVDAAFVMSFSSNGGSTWFTRNIPAYGFFASHFNSESNGTLFGNRITRTSDNGVNWDDGSPNLSFLPDGRYSTFTDFVTRPNGDIIFPTDSVIYQSSDGGLTFSVVAKYYKTIPRDTQRKILTSSISPVFYSSGTDTIILVATTSDSMFHYTTGFDFTRGYSVNIVGTTDGGKHWDKRFVIPDSLYLMGITFLDAKRGVALFHDTITLPNRYDQTTKIPNQSWQTTDGGSHWNKMEGITARIRFSDVKFNRSGTVGIILGSYGDIWVTLDSGKTWKPDPLVYFVDLLLASATTRKIVFADDTTAIIESDIGFWRKTFPTAKASVVNSGSVSNPYLYISAYPSPTNGKVIHCTVYGLYSVQAASVSFRMLDVLGREVMDITTTVRNNSNGAYSTFDIPTASLSAGVYYLILGTSNGGTTQSIVIVK